MTKTQSPEVLFNLLDEALLTWRGQDGVRRAATLPGLLAALSRGEVWDFPNARTHQFHPWSMFLTQLAVLAMQDAGATQPSKDESSWREWLLAMDSGHVEPWCLVVPNLAQPAFLQPPVPEKNLSNWKHLETPDSVDVLINSRNHDLKTEVVAPDGVEQWVLALCCLQTMQGYLGPGNYGIARMNGGFGSRPRVGLAGTGTASSRFLRDVALMLELAPSIAESASLGTRHDAHGLLWLEPWDGTTSLPLSSCRPFFVEVCRRVRLQAPPVSAWTTGSKLVRVAAKEQRGLVGDPWIPAHHEGKALSVAEGGFEYAMAANLLFEEGFVPAAAQRASRVDSEESLWMAAVLVRGEGKTEGIYERVLPLSAYRRKLLAQPDRLGVLRQMATSRIADAATASNKVLWPAIRKLYNPNDSKGDVKTPRQPQRAFTAAVDAAFFERLWHDHDVFPSDTERTLAWQKFLVALVRQTFREACRAVTVPSSQRFRALANAESLLSYLLHNRFPDAMEALRPPAPQESQQ